MEENNKILIDVEVKATEALKKMAEMQIELDQLKQSRSKVTEELKQAIKVEGENGQSVQALQEKIAEYNSKIKAGTTVLNNYTREIKGNVQQQMEYTGSLNQMRAKLSGLTGAYDNLTQAQRNSAKGTEMKEQIKNLTDEISKAEQELGNFHRQVGNYEIAGKSLKGELKALTEQMAMLKIEGKDGTQAYQEMAEKLGVIKDAMGDVKEEISNRASDTGNLTAMNQALQGVTGAFTAYNSVLGLVNINNKEFDEISKKLQVGMAALTALISIQNAVQKQSTVYIKTRALLSKLIVGEKKKEIIAEMELNAVQKVSISTNTLSNAVKEKDTIVTKAVAAAQWLWNKAIMANPVVLLITAIAALIIGIVKLTSVFSSSKKAQEEATKAQEEYERVSTEVANTIESINNKKEKSIQQLDIAERKRILELKKNGASEKEIAQTTLEYEQKKRDETIKASKQIITQKKIELAAKIKELEADEAVLKTLSKTDKEYKEKVKALQDARAAILGINKAINDAQNTIDSTNLEKQEAEQARKEEQREKAKEAAEKAKEARQKAQEKAYEREVKLLEQEKAIRDKQNELDSVGMTTDFTILQDYEKKVFAQQEDFEKKKIEVQLKYGKINKGEAEKQYDLLAKSREVFEKKQVNALEEDLKKRIAIEKKSDDELIKENERKKEEDVRIFEEEIRKRDGLNSNSELSKKQQDEINEYALARTKQEIEEEEKIKKESLDRKLKEINDKLGKEYDGDLAKYSDNESKKLELSIEKQKELIAEKKKVEGADTGGDEAQLRSLELQQQTLLLNKELANEQLTAKQKYEIKKEALEKELEIYKGNADKEREINKELAENDKDYAQKKIDNFNAWSEKISSIASDVNSLFKAMEENELSDYETKNDKKKEALKERLNNGLISQKEYDKQIAKLDSDLDKKKNELTLKEAKRERIMKLFEVATSTAAAIMKILSQGGIYATPLVALAAAQGAVQTAAILAAPLPKASKGMLLNGRSHAQGGVLIEAEGGEAIINKESTRLYAPLLSAINQAGGGVAFAKFQDGGYVARNSNNGSNDVITKLEEVKNAISNMKIITTIEDINREQKKYNKIQERGNY